MFCSPARSVLVTGAAGYVGTTLCPLLLSQGWRVLALDKEERLPYLYNVAGHPNLELCPGDCRDMRLMRGLLKEVRNVIPLAAIVGFPACERAQDAAITTNQKAIENLVGLCLAHYRIVYPNTNSGYGQTDGQSFCTEESPLKPISLYGTTKMEGEKAVLSHPLGVSLRLATVFGVSSRMRYDLLVNTFVSRLHFDGKLEVFEGQFMRNFVGVRDVARAFSFFLNNDYTGAFNVGLPTANLSKWDLAVRVAGLMGVDASRVTTKEGSDPDGRNYLISNEKLLNTGFTFEQSLEEGVKGVHYHCRLHTKEAVKSMGNA